MICNKKPPRRGGLQKGVGELSGAGSGTRTRTLLRAVDFESTASTDSAIPARDVAALRPTVRTTGAPFKMQYGESNSPYCSNSWHRKNTSGSSTLRIHKARRELPCDAALASLQSASYHFGSGSGRAGGAVSYAPSSPALSGALRPASLSQRLVVVSRRRRKERGPGCRQGRSASAGNRPGPQRRAASSHRATRARRTNAGCPSDARHTR